MRKNVVKMAAIVFATTMIGIGSASAARADERIVAKVPFAFIVGDRQLPAGEYVVRESSDGSGAIGIGSADGREFVWTLTITLSSDARVSAPQLEFEQFGSHYFLSRVVAHDGGEREVMLTPSMMERDIDRAGDRSSK